MTLKISISWILNSEDDIFNQLIIILGEFDFANTPFKERIKFEVSQRLGLWFDCSLHVDFSAIKHMLLGLIFKEVIGKIIIDFLLESHETF